MSAFWIPVIAVVVLLVLATKVAILTALARWVFKRIPDEPDHAKSVVESRESRVSGRGKHVM